MEKILTPNQVATRWNCCSNTVRAAIHMGELKAFRIGKRRFGIPEHAVRKYETGIVSPTEAAV
jgi:excisionase family DNA binding protein